MDTELNGLPRDDSIWAGHKRQKHITLAEVLDDIEISRYERGLRAGKHLGSADPLYDQDLEGEAFEMHDAPRRMAQNGGSRGFEPDFALPPGETLKETIDAIGMTERELATRIGRSLGTVDLIILGKRRISSKIAERLELALDVPAEFWLQLEKDYQESKKRLAVYECLPVRTIERTGGNDEQRTA